MELKTARLTLLIDPNKKAAFERLCAQRDLTASQVVRQMIRDYLALHGVSYEPSGDNGDGPAAPAVVAQSRQRSAPATKARQAKPVKQTTSPARAIGTRPRG